MPCPVCRVGATRLCAGSVVYDETLESKRSHDQEYWGPEYIEFTFTAGAECNNNSCSQKFALAGVGGIDQVIDTDGNSDWIESFSLRYISPTPNMITLPVKCPSSVRNRLREAFQLYWIDAEACANRLRSSLELLLTHLGVPEQDFAKLDKPQALRLHKRIEIYSASNPHVAAHLMALKWLGNAGSHGKEVGRHDILDALELLEHALAEMLEKRTEKLVELAAKLTARHGPA